jgi:hypothetical protein
MLTRDLFRSRFIQAIDPICFLALSPAMEQRNNSEKTAAKQQDNSGVVTLSATKLQQSAF